MTEDDTPTNATPETTTPEAPAESFDESMTAAMNSVYDKMEGRAEREAHRENALAPATPPVEPKDGFSQAFEKTYDHMQLSKREQDRLADERAEIDSLKEFAKTHDISLEAAHALKGAQQPQQQPGQSQIPAELQSSIESVKQIYPNVPFHQVASRYAEIDKLVKSDPVQGVAWIAKQSGMNPLQLAQQLAVRFGDQTVVMANAEGIINQWFDRNPEAAQYESGILEAIEKNAIKRTGSFETDLQAALTYAQKQQKAERKARGQGKHIDRTMRQVYSRMNPK